MKIRWSAGARQDLTDIVNYIAAESPAAALRMDELLSQAVARLSDFPRSGRLGLIGGTRELIPHKSYRIVYDLEGETVSILAIVHTARQWPTLAEKSGA